MSKRFDYVKFSESHAALCEGFKASYENIAEGIELTNVPPQARRAQALALTKLEESFMWVGKMIRDSQIERNGEGEHLPERNDS